MWLLDTTKKQLHYFARPPETYAILSHVWDDDEDSFPKELFATSWRRKVLRACAYAATDGFNWLWIDTCCIDKSNSTEMSEAINSMYQWYSGASLCYVYLADVSGGATSRHHYDSFINSQWHTRGWTLQELLASRDVMFLCSSWRPIGSKTFMAPLIHEATGIDIDVLTSRVPLSSVPVARKMAWAASRKTTRLEDEAYCLMGIFDVNFPVIYGEGRRAFRRLQEEIIRNSQDHTLFTWGCYFSEPSSVEALFNPPISPSTAEHQNVSNFDASGVLLAPSLAEFRRPSPNSNAAYFGNTRLEPVEYLDFMNTLNFFNDIGGQKAGTRVLQSYDALPEFTMSSYGVRAHLPLIAIPRHGHHLKETHDDFFIALLACRDRDRTTSLMTGLMLRRPSRSLTFQVGSWTSRTNAPQPRILDITANFLLALLADTPSDRPIFEWTTFQISGQQIAVTPLPVLSHELADFVASEAHVTIPVQFLDILRRQHLTLLQSRWLYDARGVLLKRDTVITYPFDEEVSLPGFSIHAGMCHGSLWVTVEFVEGLKARNRSRPSHLAEPIHNSQNLSRGGCPYPHVSAWDPIQDHAFSKTSTETQWSLRLHDWSRERTFTMGNKEVRIYVAVLGRFKNMPLWGLGVDVGGDWAADVGSNTVPTAMPPPSMHGSDGTGRSKLFGRLASKASKSLSSLKSS